jgi:hypothetical protein
MGGNDFFSGLLERDDQILNRRPVLDTGLGFFAPSRALESPTPGQVRGDVSGIT